MGLKELPETLGRPTDGPDAADSQAEVNQGPMLRSGISVWHFVVASLQGALDSELLCVFVRMHLCGVVDSDYVLVQVYSFFCVFFCVCVCVF